MWVTTKEAAEKMGVAVRTIQKMCQDGRIDYAKRDDRGIWLVDSDRIVRTVPKVGKPRKVEKVREEKKEQKVKIDIDCMDCSWYKKSYKEGKRCHHVIKVFKLVDKEEKFSYYMCARDSKKCNPRVGW